MLIANCWTSNRQMHVQKEGKNYHTGRTIYNSSYLVVDDVSEPQDLSSSHKSLLLRQFV
jgi:hypothetical protein